MSTDSILIFGGNYYILFNCISTNRMFSFFCLTFSILSGCGFIGRHIVKYLVDNNLASTVRVVDKVPPQIAWLNDEHKVAFESPIVEFHSANLINQSKHLSIL